MEPRAERLIGRIVGRESGPTLVVIGGIHGNEPSGPLALERVLAALAGREDQLRGELVALRGNLAALALGRRYLERDLNRLWSRQRVEALQACHPSTIEVPEDREQAELFAELEAAFGRARGRTFALDLHSTSGGGPPFVVMCDTLPNRSFAKSLPAPKVLGLEEQLEGTLLSLLSDLGHVTLAFESGQHAAASSVDHAEAAVWICLAAAGLLAGGELVPPRRVLATLDAAVSTIPPFVEARYRHAIKPADAFKMDPGFTSFQPVTRGQVLAHDCHGEVHCPETGRILMPLYQPQGDDGFFLVRAFNPVWLKISALLRRLGSDRIVHWLPGVSRHPQRLATYRVNRRIARWYALEIFHLLGFRRSGEEGAYLLVARRPHDLERDHQHTWPSFLRKRPKP
ncbi:MAG: succinylglutamate desuccinylase/aspartoacylase family protein [Thermoanaerobaculia bacterium]